jgi:hypothetical protein
MLAGFERCQGEFIMGVDRGRYSDCVDPAVLQDVAKLGGVGGEEIDTIVA